MTKSIFFKTVCFFLLFSLPFVAACGGPRDAATVSGSVTIDGRVAETGSITFIPVNGEGPSSGAAIAAGQYSASVWPGKSRVEIRVPKVVGESKLYDTPDSPLQQVMAEVLPAKYNEKSELELDVQLGQNQKDWALSAKAE
jgi:hypothetical protein